jgi:hypothetical protein
MAKTVIWLLVIICLLVGIASFFFAKFTNQQEIARARQEMEQTRVLKDSLLAQISQRDSVIGDLETETGNLKSQIEQLRSDKDSLEVERQKAEAGIFRLFQPPEYMKKFNDFYPEFSRSGWGFKEICNEKYRIGIEYFLIPTQFTSAFLQDHIDAFSYHQQVQKLEKVDSLHVLVTDYKDRIISLERENELAYKMGYDDAYAKYEELNGKYVKLLENPQIKMGIPAAATLLGSAGAGFLAGTLVSKK